MTLEPYYKKQEKEREDAFHKFIRDHFWDVADSPFADDLYKTLVDAIDNERGNQWDLKNERDLQG